MTLRTFHWMIVAMIVVVFVLIVTLSGCTFSFGRDPPPPEPTVRLCLAQREVILRRGETLRSVELQPCIPALGEFR